MSDIHLRLGTRGSLLARRQSDWVAREIVRHHPGVIIETIVIKTTGDQITDRPLHEAGGKGLFVKELEQALLDNTIDFAVHSYKDVPVTLPLVDQANLIIAATPIREDPRDVLISRDSQTITELPAVAKIGTDSLRRRCQLLAMRPDLSIQSIRGNIDTRIKKLHAGEFDAIVLALAGVRRAGLFEAEWMHIIPAAEVLPAPGQGALAIQCRKNDYRTIEAVSRINHTSTAICVAAERALVAELEGDCHSPIAALAEIHGETMDFRAVVGAAGGQLPVVAGKGMAAVSHWKDAVNQAAKLLYQQDVKSILNPSR